jgi:transcription elongation GreA/GreB family factor
LAATADPPSSALNKIELLFHVRGILQNKVADAEREIDSVRGSFASDTKSSAGDKHEVGRAMVQQELDKLEEQRAKLITLQQELARVPLERVFDRAAFGSLVRTDQGVYFLTIGLGRVELKGESCFVISLASPLGSALKDKQVGEQVSFNGTVSVIRSVA